MQQWTSNPLMPAPADSDGSLLAPIEAGKLILVAENPTGRGLFYRLSNGLPDVRGVGLQLQTAMSVGPVTVCATWDLVLAVIP
jgi:hypothetical protein